MLENEFVTFSQNFLDRSGNHRSNQKKINEYLCKNSAQYLIYWRGKVPVVSDVRDQLCWVGRDHPLVLNYSGMPTFLGLENDIPFFSINISSWLPGNYNEAAAGAFFDSNIYNHPDLPESSFFAELRGFMNRISAQEAELAVMTRGINVWQENNLYCSKCGNLTEIINAGWQRNCVNCGAFHFPRTDPVVIMLVTHGNNILLGRSHGWPDKMYSCLAGFMEPGESIEAAVQREVLEETSILVKNVRYLTSQPWPFPSSLMIGCVAEALSKKVLIDPKEIENALWVSREEMLEAFSGNNERIYPARVGSIAHFMIKKWLSGNIE